MENAKDIVEKTVKSTVESAVKKVARDNISKFAPKLEVPAMVEIPMPMFVYSKVIDTTTAKLLQPNIGESVNFNGGNAYILPDGTDSKKVEVEVALRVSIKDVETGDVKQEK